MTQNSILNNCEPLTVGQRCADWFVLRQFRVTGTNAGQVFLSKNEVREVLGLERVDVCEERGIDRWFGLFYDGWISSKVSTEAMLRGSLNEEAVISSLRAKSFVKEVFDIGMVAMRQQRYLACSPDGVALLHKSYFGEWSVEVNGVAATGEDNFVLATVEIKTRVAASSLGASASLSAFDLIRCDIGDETFRKYVPKEHMAQLIHQLVVLRFGLALYVCAAETGILYIVIVRCPSSRLECFRLALTTAVTQIVIWAHEQQPTIPSYVKPDFKHTLTSRLHFWQIIDGYVKLKGPFPPIKLFKHGAQSFYSKTKAGVDGATQFRAVLRSSTSHFQWEQKVVSKTIKTIAVNAFIGWRMYERRDLLQSQEMFRSVDSYRNLLNKVQPTSEFMLDVSQELLSHAATLTLASGGVQQRHDVEDQTINAQSESISKEDIKRLVRLAHNRKNKRLAFFNSADGNALRLAVPGHEPLLGKSLHCSLCGQNPGRKRGHRSSYVCTLCDVNLCLRVHPGLRKTCWSIWHTQKELKLRTTPDNPTASRRSNDNSRTGSSSRASRGVLGHAGGARGSLDGNAEVAESNSIPNEQGGHGGERAGEDVLNGAQGLQRQGRVTRSGAIVSSTATAEDENAPRQTRASAARAKKRRTSTQDTRPTRKRKGR